MASESDDQKQTTASGLRALSPEARASAASSPRAAPPPNRYGVGDVIAEKYRLGRRLGEGGMGEVWFAHYETLDIDVAIKLIRADVATPEMADRLLHEARAAARLGHPAIVRVNDFGKTNRGDPFIVMELLAGEDLANALAKRGRLSAIKAVRTLLPIAHALTVAHNKGIVHRDLKPENVFLAKNDEGQIQPKLVDFGVAKLEKLQSHRLTQSGALLGSPLYMSPEQARGDDVDHRADIWALAVVLYETITGRPPFEGKNYNAVLYSITANPPTPITDLDVGDAELWTILDRGLQKDPDRRWYSMRDFGEALARWLEDRNVHEDITGSSLQTAWFQWKRDEDQLAAGPSARPPTDEATGALPPVPHPAPEMGGEPLHRQREITVRKLRTDSLSLYLFGAIAVALVLFLVLVVVLMRKPRGAVNSVASSTSAAVPVVPVAVPSEEAAPANPEHERAVEEALAGGSPTPPAAPVGVVQHPTDHADHVRAAPALPKAPAVTHGIYTTDPYRSGPKPALKNPFQ